MPSRRSPATDGQSVPQPLGDQPAGDPPEPLGVEGAEIDDVEIHADKHRSPESGATVGSKPQASMGPQATVPRWHTPSARC